MKTKLTDKQREVLKPVNERLAEIYVDDYRSRAWLYWKNSEESDRIDWRVFKNIRCWLSACDGQAPRNWTAYDITPAGKEALNE